MFTDIKRICENPTDEDYEWFPELAGLRLVRSGTFRYAQLQR